MRPLALLLILVLSSCTSLQPETEPSTDFYAERLKINIIGLEEAEDQIVLELDNAKPKNERFHLAWEERKKTYKHSCAYYRLMMIGFIEFRAEMYDRKQITEEEYENLVTKDLEALLVPYLRALMVNGVHSSLLRSVIHIHVSNLSKTVAERVRIEETNE